MLVVMLIVGYDLSQIDRLNNDLSKYFRIKDLGPTKKILGMTIPRNKKTKKFSYHKNYILKSTLRGSIWTNLKWLALMTSD